MAVQRSRCCVLMLGTCDTKLSELLYVRSHLLQHDVDVKLSDVGWRPTSHPDISYSHAEVLSHLSYQPKIDGMDRGEVIKTMISAASALVTKLHADQIIDGIICIGGSGGTSLGASVMRSALPIGFPKLIVSTVASGNVSNFVGETDMTMMYSVVDIAGQNSILNPILENAAGMIAGAAKAFFQRFRADAGGSSTERKMMNFLSPIFENAAGMIAGAVKAFSKRLGADAGDDSTKRKTMRNVAITMFGVTTPAADAARLYLEENGYEVFVFHATGVGGRAMEKLIMQHQIDGVLDLTTTELADELIGGIMSAGPDRLTAAARTGIPQVVSLGALDIVNFGPRVSVPGQFGQRRLHEHNPDITVMRTSIDENRTLGKQMAEKLRTHTIVPDTVQVFIPQGGISMLSTRGGPFYDEAANKALFSAITEGLNGSDIAVVEDQRAINDKGFATDMAKSLIQMMQKES